MKKKEFDPVTFSFMVGYHLLLAISLPLYLMHRSAPMSAWVIAGILFILSGLSITAGYHRLYSHTAYKANPIVEAFFLFFGAIAIENSAIKWSFEHRLHHAFCDSERDPYNINEGFWYAHILWLFRKQEKIDKKVVNDLFANKKTLFQHNNYLLIAFGGNVLLSLIFGYMMNDYLAAFIITWLLRMFVLHHATWFINSLAHTWGTNSYSNEHTAMDNMLISFLTFGEGYHNYHHTFGHDYRNGVKWFNFDPTKWLIWTLSKLGLAKNLKRANEAKVQQHILEEEKGAVMEKIKGFLDDQKRSIELKMDELTGSIISKYKELINAQKNLIKAKQEHLDKTKIKKYRSELASIKKEIVNQKVSWHAFCKKVVKLDSKASKLAHA